MKASEFEPYCHINEEGNALTAYFSNVYPFRKIRIERVVLHLPLDNDDIVGCRIEGIGGLLEDLEILSDALTLIKLTQEQVETILKFIDAGDFVQA